jgi:cytochrome c-type biogenesis protein CcmE
VSEHAKSSSRKTWRFIAFGAILVCLIAFLALAIARMGSSIVYYWGPTELNAARERAVGASIRLGGQVVPGSIARREGEGLTFVVRDARETICVRTRAVPPQMFREGIGVVVEGTLDRDGVFEGTRLLVSHGNEYKAPHDKGEIETRLLIQSTAGLDKPAGKQQP